MPSNEDQYLPDSNSPYTLPDWPSKLWPWLGIQTGGYKKRSTLSPKKKYLKYILRIPFHTCSQKCNVVPMFYCGVALMNDNLTEGHHLPADHKLDPNDQPPPTCRPPWVDFCRRDPAPQTARLQAEPPPHHRHSGPLSPAMSCQSTGGCAGGF